MERSKARGKGKGSQFEREVSKLLSLWWTDNERDDIFWRTTSSGARATFRKAKGKSTFGQNGDIQAIDPIGQPLIDLISIEIKRGYKGHSLQEIVDKRLKKPCVYEDWFKQAQDNETPYWMLIVKRDIRVPIFFMPRLLGIHLCKQGSSLNWFPQMTIRTKTSKGTVMCGVFTDFLHAIKKKHVIEMHRKFFHVR